MAQQMAGYADLTSLIKDLEQAGARADRGAERLLDTTSTTLKDMIIAAAPEDTGKLKSSTSVTKPERLTRVVGPDVFYAPFLEFGTGSRGEYPGSSYEIRPKTASALSFMVGGRQVRTQRVVHPGIAARPFVRPALKAVLQPFTQDLADMGALSITKGPRSML